MDRPHASDQVLFRCRKSKQMTTAVFVQWTFFGVTNLDDTVQETG